MVEFSDLFDCEVDEFQKKAKVNALASTLRKTRFSSPAPKKIAVHGFCAGPF